VNTGCFYGPALPHEPCFSFYASSPLVAGAQHIGGPIPVLSCDAPPCAFDPFRDVVQVGDAYVFDLAANVSELTSERAFSETDACYAGHVLRDPSCPVEGGPLQTRGGGYDVGDFVDLRAETPATAYPPDYSLPDTGFRCAYPAAPVKK
jgi:hypothetical protein